MASTTSPMRSWRELPRLIAGSGPAVDLQQGQVGLGVQADDFGLDEAAVTELHLDLGGVTTTW